MCLSTPEPQSGLRLWLGGEEASTNEGPRGGAEGDSMASEAGLPSQGPAVVPFPVWTACAPPEHFSHLRLLVGCWGCRADWGARLPL